MERWKEFLESLATRGGNIFVLGFFVILLLVVSLTLLLRGLDNPAVTLVVGAFSGFQGALIAVLTGSGSRQRVTDKNGATPAPGGSNGQSV